MRIDIPSVIHVYLRKHEGLGSDDPWRLKEVTVVLMRNGSHEKTFASVGPATLGNEFGNQVWLRKFGA